MEAIVAIVLEVTRYYLERHGQVRLYCAPASTRLVTAVKKQLGLTLEHVSGFFGIEEHHWTIDRSTGIIYDATASQFGVPNGAVLPTDSSYRSYQEVPPEIAAKLPQRADLRYDAWLSMKKFIGVKDELRGSNILASRVSKRGDKYVYYSRIARFVTSFGDSGWQFRSALIWETKTGYRFSIVEQLRVVKDGKVRYPTRLVRYVIHNGKSFEVRGGKMHPCWIQDSLQTVMHDLGMDCFCGHCVMEQEGFVHSWNRQSYTPWVSGPNNGVI